MKKSSIFAFGEAFKVLNLFKKELHHYSSQKATHNVYPMLLTKSLGNTKHMRQ